MLLACCEKSLEPVELFIVDIRTVDYSIFQQWKFRASIKKTKATVSILFYTKVKQL